MGIKTIKTCDRCGKECEGESRWVGVGLAETNTTYNPLRIEGKLKLWCFKCLNDCGLEKLFEGGKRVEPATPEPTLEDMVRDIVADEIDNQQGQGG